MTNHNSNLVKDVELTVHILDNNAKILSMRLLEKLAELKLPFLVGSNNYPIMINNEDIEISKKIYEEICIDFLENYKLK
jgi:hypothetical protein